MDLSHSQPFWAHGVPDLATVHNGHVTNYHKLRRQYEQRGYRFFTWNDSEVIGVYLRDRMSKGLTFEDALRSSLDDFERISLDLIPGMRIANSTRTANYEWLDAIDVANMIETCELICHSSLERRESRGPFFRSDFPLTDNQSWLAANVLRKSGNGFAFERRPYELPFLQPDFAVRDNLEVAW